MRVSSVTLSASNLLEPMTFSLNKADPSNLYIVRGILGLDAEEIIPKFYGFSNYTKARYYQFGLKSREIVMRIVLNPNYTLNIAPSDIRDDLYRAISATRAGLLTLSLNDAGGVVAQIQGSIVKFEASHMTNLPEVQITLRCDDPLLRSPNPVDLSTMTVANPFIIPDSISTAPHGFVMQLTVTAATPNLEIRDVQTNWEWHFMVTPPGGFAINDVIYFSSEFANKYLYMIRGGVTTQLMDTVAANSFWPVIFPGANSMTFIAPTSYHLNSLTYSPAFWGV